MWGVTLLAVWKDEWNRYTDGNEAYESEKKIENVKDLYITILRKEGADHIIWH